MNQDELLLPLRIERFWARIDRSGGPDACWVWSGAPVKTTGYGQCVAIQGLPCRPPRGITTPHRQAWIITNGDPGTHPSPKDGHPITNRIRHRCPGGPNKLCCNPAHLEVGSDKDNADDRASDGNTFRGEQITISKLTEAAVEEALLAHADGFSIYSLAKLNHVAHATMASALHGDTWTHVRPDLPRRPRVAPRRTRVDA
jgi:hypothetical protein